MQFAALGAELIITSRSAGKLDSLKKKIESEHNVPVHCYAFDVRDRKAVEAFYNELPERLQAVDILLNNAGLASGFDLIQESNLDDIEDMIDTNLKGLLYVTRAFTPKMAERNSGHIINLGSLAGHEVYPRGAVYCATKFGVNALSKGFRFDLLGHGIKVTSIDPGLVETNFSVIRFHGDSERAKNVYKGLDPLVAEDIADAVIYAATRPPHVNINEIIMTPVAQGSTTISHRKS